MPQEPSVIYRGVTLGWKRAAAETTYIDAGGNTVECPASEWTLKYKFAGPAGAFEITAVADGADYSASATAAATALYPVGEYAGLPSSRRDPANRFSGASSIPGPARSRKDRPNTSRGWTNAVTPRRFSTRSRP